MLWFLKWQSWKAFVYHHILLEALHQQVVCFCNKIVLRR